MDTDSLKAHFNQTVLVILHNLSFTVSEKKTDDVKCLSHSETISRHSLCSHCQQPLPDAKPLLERIEYRFTDALTQLLEKKSDIYPSVYFKATVTPWNDSPECSTFQYRVDVCLYK
jgi:hypothetical protein